jgi:dual specificity phosphatase 12
MYKKYNIKITMPTEILPSLWIGDYKDSADIGFLEKNNIKVIINCTKDLMFIDEPQIRRLKKIRIPVDDRPSQSYYDDNMIMYHTMHDVIKEIHEYITSDKPVLVHCQMGKQRSAAVIAGYFIMYGNVDVNTAVQYIRSKRPKCFYPKVNFELALTKFHTHLNT